MGFTDRGHNFWIVNLRVEHSVENYGLIELSSDIILLLSGYNILCRELRNNLVKLGYDWDLQTEVTTFGLLISG